MRLLLKPLASGVAAASVLAGAPSLAMATPPLIFPRPALIHPAEKKLITPGPLVAAPMFVFITGPTGSPYTFEFVTSAVINAAQTIYTFSSQSFGAADDDREIFVFAGSGTPSDRTVSSITIGGVTATLGTNFHNSGSSHIAAFASVPTGTSGDIVVTFSGGASHCGLSVYRVINRPNSPNTNTDAQSAVGLSTSSTLSSCTVNANGFIIGVSAHSNNNATSSSILTIDADTNLGSAKYAFSSYPIQGSSSTPSQRWSWTGSATFRSSLWAFD